MTDSFVEPNESNFASMIIKNGSEVSNKIKQLMETTATWLKTESIEPEEASEAYIDRHESSNIPSELKISSSNDIQQDAMLETKHNTSAVNAGLIPEPIPF